jgi:hypothetical protein
MATLPFPYYSACTMMTLSACPMFTIDCMLATRSTPLEADGCVLKCVEDRHTLTTPEHLRVGDTVKVQLWLEGEEAFLDIRLAVVTKVHQHWIAVEVLRVSPHDRLRLQRFTISMEEPTYINHLLIRA